MKTVKHSVDALLLPKTVSVDGKSYPIRWDFSAALQFMEYVDTSEDEDEVFLHKVLEIWYPQIPDNSDEALTQAVRFYCGGNLPQEGYYAPIFPVQEDRTGIYQFFLNHYGINLKQDCVHWWVFRQLLEQYQNGRNQWN